MITSKCTSSECGKKFTEQDIAELKREGKKFSQNCPYCDNKLTSNTTEKLERKKWYGYLNPDKTIVEHLVLVVIDQFEDYSTEVEVPLLNHHISESDRLSGLQAAAKAINDYLLKEYGLSYDNDRQFMTVAYQDETDLMRHKVPVWW
jgi:hypothetical protein